MKNKLQKGQKSWMEQDWRELLDYPIEVMWGIYGYARDHTVPLLNNQNIYVYLIEARKPPYKWWGCAIGLMYDISLECLGMVELSHWSNGDVPTCPKVIWDIL